MRLCYSCMQPVQDEKVHTCPHCGESLAGTDTSSPYLPPGTVLQGKFIVGKLLGAGGFGNTYIGWSQVLLRRVAIKEYYPEQITSRMQDGVTVSVTESTMQQRFRAGLQQFLEEARSVANLQDVRGVVEIYNFFEANGTGYIVMEYLEGMDVRTILKKSGGKRDYEWCRRVILTVLYTLREVHKRGVLHRDIAPDNIFVTNEGVVKLIDFGAAKHASELANLRQDVILKAGYAPIEQYSRTAHQGVYTDLYAVAALFYRMLTGMKPLPANERVVQDSIVMPSQMGIVLPEQAELAIMVCLNVQPEFRLQSAEEFMEALEGQNFVPVYDREWILPPEAVADSGRFGKLSSLSTGMKAALCLLVLCLIGGGAVGIEVLTHQEKTVQSSGDAVGQIIVGNCIGKYKEDALELLQNQGFTHIAEPVYEYNPEIAAGKVTRQNIAPGESAGEGDEIILTVSGGEARYTIPDCSGMSEKEVRDYFDQRNTMTEIKEAYSEEIKKGRLISQSVAAGTPYRVEDYDILVFEYSLGSKKDYEKKMPDLVGLSEKQAKKKLKEKGITVKVKIDSETRYSDVEKGKVAAQTPEKGKKINIREAKKIILYKSKGPKPVPRPTATPTATPRRRIRQTPKPKRTPKPTEPPLGEPDDDYDWW